MSAELVLGTVQFGLDYGAANVTGMPTQDQVDQILLAFAASGGTTLDTARAYGESEVRIGAYLAQNERTLQVVTKLAPDADDAERARLSVEESCRWLRTRTLPTLLLHRPEHRRTPAWDQLRSMRDAGRIERLGVSLATPEQLIDALTDPDVQHVQAPFNLLDRRWLETRVQHALTQRPDVTIHTRSALLQGLLGADPHVWPQLPDLDAFGITDWLKAEAARHDREDRVDLALAYARSQTWIHGVVVGVETLEQLRRNLRLFENPPLSQEQCRVILERVPRVPDSLLDPARWPKR